jgi:alcohol dehydrogenase class IV
MGAVMCGRGTDHTGAGIATVLGHAIGARYDVENGIAKAIVLPHVLRFNAEAAPQGLRKLAMAVGASLGDTASHVEVVTGALDALFGSLGLPRRLRELGLPREALSAIAVQGMGDWFLRGNPRQVRGAAELQEVLDAAW